MAGAPDHIWWCFADFFIIDLRILNGKECLLLNWWNLHRGWDNKKTMMMTATMTMMLTLSTNTNTMIMMTMLVMSTLMVATIPGQILWSWCWLPGRSQVPPASPRPWPFLPSPCWPAPPSYHNHNRCHHPRRLRSKLCDDEQAPTSWAVLPWQRTACLPGPTSSLASPWEHHLGVCAIVIVIAMVIVIVVII